MTPFGTSAEFIQKNPNPFAARYRWYEIVSVYGTTIKELMQEEFGDGIMSAIDFSMDIVRQPDPKGDRVNVVLSGKFLPYKQS